MDRNFNIVPLLIFTGIFVSACSPNIRFASNINHNSIEKNKKYALRTVAKPKDFDNQQIASILNTYKFSDIIDDKRKDVLNFAKSWIGTPYCYGGENKSCTDCSGFVMQIFENAGIRLPRTAALQYEYGEDIHEKDIAPGDLIFFNRSGKIGHVGIFIGNSSFIHASSKKGVIIQSIYDEYYKKTFAGFKRVI